MIPLLIMGCFFGALLLSIGLNRLALIPWRRSVGAHWAERARLLFPARRAAKSNLFFLVGIVFATTVAFAPHMNPLVTVVPAFFGGLLAGYFLNREIFPDVTFMQWLQFIVAIWLLLSPVVVLVVAVFVMPGNFGIVTWIIAVCAVVLLLWLQFGLNIRVLRCLRVFRPAPERLAALVHNVSEKMSVPTPATWVVDTPISNAAALPGPRQLVFTEKLLATHTDDEIKAICAHELGHLTEPESVRLTRLLLPLLLLPFVFLKPIDFVIGPAVNESTPGSAVNGFLCSILIVFVPVVLCFIIAKRLGRRMEKRADEVAVKHQEDPTVYARALERLYQTNQMPAVMPRRVRPSVHPDLYDRMLAAGITPDYPRPASPPARLYWPAYILMGIYCLPIVVYAVTIARNAFMARLQQ